MSASRVGRAALGSSRKTFCRSDGVLLPRVPPCLGQGCTMPRPGSDREGWAGLRAGPGLPCGCLYSRPPGERVPEGQAACLVPAAQHQVVDSQIVASNNRAGTEGLNLSTAKWQNLLTQPRLWLQNFKSDHGSEGPSLGSGSARPLLWDSGFS